MTINVLHISDLHVGGTPIQGPHGEHISRSDFLVKTVIPRLVALGKSLQPCVFVVTGDIVNDGKEGQIDLARSILEPLYKNFSVLPIPGNHDCGPSGILARKKSLLHFNRTFYGTSDIVYPRINTIAGHTFIGLNSMRASFGVIARYFADGKLGRQQRQRVREEIDKVGVRSDAKKVIVYLHHHPFLFPDEKPTEILVDWIGHELRDGNKFMRSIRNKVDVLLFGHEHRHLQFEGTNLNSDYGIPFMFSSSSLTSHTVEYPVKKDGCADFKSPQKTGFLCRRISISSQGAVVSETLTI